LIERVWRHLKDKLRCHRWWANLDALPAATATLLDHMEARFHRPDGITIRPVQNFCRVAQRVSEKGHRANRRSIKRVIAR
jgi:hypothetical protein